MYRYQYIVDDAYGDAANMIHHVEIRKSSNRKGFYVALFISLMFFAAASSVAFHLPTLVNDSLIPQPLYWLFLFPAICLLKLVRRKVVKESVVIMPNFGIQLETHYTSGGTIRRFIPMNKILKPVLVECLTPITCYWTLSLLMYGEDQEELVMVFKDLRPPVGILVPVWKALRAAAAATDTWHSSS